MAIVALSRCVLAYSSVNHPESLDPTLFFFYYVCLKVCQRCCARVLSGATILRQELVTLPFCTIMCILSAPSIWVICACKIELFQELVFSIVGACYEIFRDGAKYSVCMLKRGGRNRLSASG